MTVISKMPQADTVSTPRLIKAVIKAESNFDPRARSRAGALGLMQLMPQTARAMSVDPYDPRENILGGTKYLNYLYEDQVKKRTPDKSRHLRLLLASYNAGPSKVFPAGQVPNYPETRDYVRKVTRLFNKSGGGEIKTGSAAYTGVEPRLCRTTFQSSRESGLHYRGEPVTVKTCVWNRAGHAPAGKVIFSFNDYCKIVKWPPNASKYKISKVTVLEVPVNDWPAGKNHEVAIELEPSISGRLEYKVRVELEDPAGPPSRVSFPYRGVLDATKYPASVMWFDVY